MDTPNAQAAGTARRVIAALLLAAGLGGCVYGPPYAYDATGAPYYGYPTYVGPPISLDLGFGFYDGPSYGHYGHYGHRGHHHGARHHGGSHHHGGSGHGHRGGRGRH
jgi:hypothetical protein